MNYLMKCGHIANAFTHDDKPACAICLCTDVVRECRGKDGLDGREMVCPYCMKKEPSSWGAPFFEYRPNKDTDSFYCGCRGWD